MSDESRGQGIKRQREALGLSVREMEDAIAEELGITRATIARAEEGKASRSTYHALEGWLAREMEEAGLTDEGGALVGAQPVEVEMYDVYGVGRVIARGTPDEVADAVGKILERLKSQED